MDFNQYLDQLKQTHLQTLPEKKGLSKCPYGCTNGYFIRVDEQNREWAKECKCRKELITNNRIRFASIPEMYKDVTLDNFKSSVYRQAESKKVISIVSQMIRAYLGKLQDHMDTGKGLYIYSHTKGSGKTRFAASIANELLKREIQTKFSTSSKIINEIRATWDKDKGGPSESDLLNALVSAEVLIIDDFGTEKIKDWINDKFYSIINERYNNKKVTFYTSNYEPSELPYDERIISRVKETSFIVQFPEECVRDLIADRDNEEMISQIGG